MEPSDIVTSATNERPTTPSSPNTQRIRYCHPEFIFRISLSLNSDHPPNLTTMPPTNNIPAADNPQQLRQAVLDHMHAQRIVPTRNNRD